MTSKSQIFFKFKKKDVCPTFTKNNTDQSFHDRGLKIYLWIIPNNSIGKLSKKECRKKVNCKGWLLVENTTNL